MTSGPRWGGALLREGLPDRQTSVEALKVLAQEVSSGYGPGEMFSRGWTHRDTHTETHTHTHTQRSPLPGCDALPLSMPTHTHSHERRAESLASPRDEA